MTTTIELYHAAKAASGCTSDYAFAKKYNVTQQAVSNWANGKVTFSDDHAEMIAGILKVDPGYVMACANAERARSEKSKSTWVRVAALLLASALPPAAGAADFNQVATSHNTQGSMYIMSNRRTLLQRLMAALSGPDFFPV